MLARRFNALQNKLISQHDLDIQPHISVISVNWKHLIVSDLSTWPRHTTIYLSNISKLNTPNFACKWLDERWFGCHECDTVGSHYLLAMPDEPWLYGMHDNRNLAGHNFTGCIVFPARSKPDLFFRKHDQIFRRRPWRLSIGCRYNRYKFVCVTVITMTRVTPHWGVVATS